jgi:SAM-dependent methyltransferase
MKLDNLPFYIGAMDTNHNPVGIPDAFPFQCEFNEGLGIIRQRSTPTLEKLLWRVYDTGLLIGTPLQDDRLALPYVEDFLNFVSRNVRPRAGTRVLEVGAGTGYLTRRLIDLGYEVTAVEPGKGYSECWKRHRVDVINEFFPCARATGSYDVVICYLVLEHMVDPVEFLSEFKKVLSVNGVIILVVPDEEEEITAGDPCMLVHEHFSYFDRAGLRHLLNMVGLSANVEKSKYGRLLYSTARQNDSVFAESYYAGELQHTYPQRALEYVDRFKEKLRCMVEKGSVGVFCPSRALPLIDSSINVRFFDDDKFLHGKYFPPFLTKIENRSSLCTDPVDTVLIMSRTFGAAIKDSLRGDGYRGDIALITDLL